MASAEDYSPQEPLEFGEEPTEVGALVASDSGEIAEEYDLEEALLGNVAKSDKINRLIQLAMAGALPLGRPLKPWEPDKLNPRHISCIMLRAVGYRQNRIAELTGYVPAQVSVILRHPASQVILAAILSEGAKQAIDINAQVEREAPKVLKVVKDIINDVDVKPETRVRAAFGWLGMYERQKEKEQTDDTPEKVTLHRDDASRLISALAESRQIREVPYVLVSASQPTTAQGAQTAAPSSAPNKGILPGDALDPAHQASIDSALRQHELESALEARIAAAEQGVQPAQGQADGAELRGVTHTPLSDVSRSVIPGRGPRTSAEHGFSVSPSAVDVCDERQVSRSDVEEVA